MSHGRERIEKDCLNCGTTVQGFYCHVCGQANTQPHETVWSLINHFFSDITHFDGKFFKTIGVLLTKPGFLSQQFIAGKRERYLNPIRMYVFTSALFFLVFFSFYKVDGSDWTINGGRWQDVQVDQLGERAYQSARTHQDSVDIGEALGLFRNHRDTASDKVRKRGGIEVADSDDYKTIEQYDSIQLSLPQASRDNWFKRLLTRKALDINTRYPGQENKMTADIINKFMHTFPALLFISLPLYAFFLYLLYIRRKRFFFADHAIFLIHQYVFSFMVLLVLFLLLKVPTAWINWLIAAIVIYGIFYTVKAFRTFYGQGWGKTILKFIVFNVVCLMSLLCLFIIFFGYALLQV